MGFLMKINAQKVAFYLSHIQKGGHFDVSLCKRGVDLTDAVLDKALNQFVGPLLRVSESATFYHKSSTRRSPKRSVPKPPLPNAWLKKTESILEIDLNRVDLAGDRNFWRYSLGGTDGQEGALVLLIPTHSFPLTLVAVNCWDPVFLANPAMIAPSAALRFCQQSAVSGAYVCCLFTRCSISIDMGIYASPCNLKGYYTECVRKCRFTGSALERELRSK
jgi:hypothetical protein